MPAPLPSPPMIDGAQVAGTLRTLGSGHLQACPGDDARLGTPTSATTTPTIDSIPLSHHTDVYIDSGWIVDASGSLSGKVSTGTQTFAGLKTFTGNIKSDSLTANTANTSLTLVGNRSAADAGTDLVLNSVATRSNGSLLDIQNNTTSKLTVDYSGRILATAATLSLVGNMGDGGHAVGTIIDTGVTYANPAALLLSLRNNTVEKASVDKDGVFAGGASITAGSFWLGGIRHTVGTAAPIAGAWNLADICWNSNPSSGGIVGWICVLAGTPGTWKEFGLISL